LGEKVFQRIQPVQPKGCKLFERRADFGKRTRVQVKAVVLARAHTLQNAGALQNLEVARNGRRRNLERLRQFRDRAVRARHAKEDFPSRPIRKRAEDLVDFTNLMLNHSVNSYPSGRVRCQQKTINIYVKCICPADLTHLTPLILAATTPSTSAANSVKPISAHEMDSGRGLLLLKSRVNRLAFHREHAENAFVNATKRFLSDKSLKGFDTKCELT